MKYCIYIIIALSIGYCQISHGQRLKRDLSVESVIDRFWEWRLRESPEYGTKYKLFTNEDQVEEYTEQAFTRKVSEAEDLLSAVNSVPTESLSTQDSINIKILKSLLEGYINGYQYRVYSAYNPVNNMGSLVEEFEITVGRMRFESLQDYRNMISRLQHLPKSFEEHIRLMEIAVSERKTLSNYSVTSVLEHFDNTLDKDITELKFYQPFMNIPDSISQSDRDDLIQQADSILREHVIPAIQNMRDFMANVKDQVESQNCTEKTEANEAKQTYIPNTRPEIGVSSLEGGAEYYQACLDWHLSTSLTPQEIHNIGLSEVQRILGLMGIIMINAGFNGTLKEYIAYMKSKPENFYQTEDEMTEGYRSLVRVIKDNMPAAFETITNIELRVEGISSKYGGSGFYADPSADGKTPGVFTANVYDAPSRPKFNMMALTLHESYPGHHQQTGHAIEQGLPDFRRLIEFRKYYSVPFNWQFFTAYIEGWGLYAEKLGEADSMDVYKDQDSLFGRYNWEMFRACRLVVDTGIHALGWSRQQAIDYMAQYSSLPRLTIENEVNRYISWPGQATAYKIGELKIVELREKAQNELGSHFDLKKFHSRVLDVGPVPLNILEDVINDWIKDVLDKQTAGASRISGILHIILALYILQWSM